MAEAENKATEPEANDEPREGAYLDEVQTVLRTTLEKEGIDGETRVRVMAAVESDLRAREIASVKGHDRKRWQIKFLRVVFAVSMALTAVSWWRLGQVDERALSSAYQIFLDRMRVQSQIGLKAMNIVLDQVVKWGKEVEADKTASEEDKRIRMGNLVAIGDWVRKQRQGYQDGYDRIKGIKVPDRISPSTYVEDPWTGQKMPLNATAGGRLDEGEVTKFLQNDKMTLMMIAAARYHSQPGREALGSDPDTWKFQVDEQLLKSFGIDPARFKNATVEERAKATKAP